MTSEFILAPGEEFIQCPYNMAHQITNARMITHLDKCRKAYLKSPEGLKCVMKVCRYDATHHVPKVEIKFHEERCPQAASVLTYLSHHNSAEGQRYYDMRRQQDLQKDSERERQQGDERGYRDRDRDRRRDRDRHRHGGRSSHEPKTEPRSGANAPPIEEEDWEAESTGYHPGYDPQTKLKSELVMYNPQGLTKAERKKYRNEVRLRHAERTLTGKPLDLPLPSEFEVKPDVSALSVGDKKVFAKSETIEAGELIDSDDEFEVIDYANQTEPPPKTSSSTTSGYSRYSTSSYSRPYSYEYEPEGASRHSTSSYSRRYSNDFQRRGQDEEEEESTSKNKESDEEEWPWTDGANDYIPDDTDDFPGYDPYA